MIVVDTNVILHLWLETPETAAAEALLESDSEWGAPLLWRSEIRNALALLIRHRSFPLQAAKEIVRSAEELMAGREFAVPSDDVLDLAQRSGCSAYDCEFVALAVALDVPLVTTDRKVLRAFPKTARALRPR
ncbi:MAG TPA: type II toxin-antitoxin system VapC family toxin [Thermoanaerobaculia bacterium]|nr:type II toxin-antitoxin system VapC family toxin [Thermoanaerobaculia bacterium]